MNNIQYQLPEGSIINELVDILFIPETYFVSSETRTGLRELRIAQAQQILAVVKRELLQAETAKQLASISEKEYMADFLDNKLDELIAIEEIITTNN
jgi:hypothetical protein